MKLHKFEIGHRCPGTVSHGNPVTRCNVRITGVKINLSGAAGGKNRRGGPYNLHVPIGSESDNPNTLAIVIGQQDLRFFSHWVSRPL